MSSSKWFSVCAISLFASIAGNAMAEAITYGGDPSVKKVSDVQLEVTGGKGKTRKFFFSSGPARDNCAAAFAKAKGKKTLGIFISWTTDILKNDIVKTCALNKKTKGAENAAEAAVKAGKKPEKTEEKAAE